MYRGGGGFSGRAGIPRNPAETRVSTAAERKRRARLGPHALTLPVALQALTLPIASHALTLSRPMPPPYLSRCKILPGGCRPLPRSEPGLEASQNPSHAERHIQENSALSEGWVSWFHGAVLGPGQNPHPAADSACLGGNGAFVFCTVRCCDRRAVRRVRTVVCGTPSTSRTTPAIMLIMPTTSRRRSGSFRQQVARNAFMSTPTEPTGATIAAGAKPYAMRLPTSPPAVSKMPSHQSGSLT